MGLSLVPAHKLAQLHGVGASTVQRIKAALAAACASSRRDHSRGYYQTTHADDAWNVARETTVFIISGGVSVIGITARLEYRG